MPARKKGLGRRLIAARYIYLLLLPGLVYYLIFCYIPMGGVVMAFQNYKARLGIFGSPWVGLDNFRRIFITPRDGCDSQYAAHQFLLHPVYFSRTDSSGASD